MGTIWELLPFFADKMRIDHSQFFHVLRTARMGQVLTMLVVVMLFADYTVEFGEIAEAEKIELGQEGEGEAEKESEVESKKMADEISKKAERFAFLNSLKLRALHSYFSSSHNHYGETDTPPPEA